MSNRFSAAPRPDGGPGWLVIDDDGGYPFGDNVMALNKRFAVALIRERLIPVETTPAPRAGGRWLDELGAGLA
jgi:hypothetical protein